MRPFMKLIKIRRVTPNNTDDANRMKQSDLVNRNNYPLLEIKQVF
jgi:hypothetical protein